MSRVKGGTVTHARHKKIVKQAKGYYGRRKNTFKGQRRLLTKPINTPPATVITASAISARCGFSGSMRPCAVMMRL